MERLCGWRNSDIRVAESGAPVSANFNLVGTVA
jgi:hypothetical protein